MSNAVAASLRAYSTNAPGVHTLTAVATQSDGLVVERSGNFEVVGIVANNGRTAKNIIIMLGDGMGAAHRTAARIMAKGYAQGKAQEEELHHLKTAEKRLLTLTKMKLRKEG